MNGIDGRGWQAERTALSWRRTTLAASVTALVAVGRVVRGGATPARIAALVIVVTVWAAVLLVAHGRIRTLQAVRSRTPVASWAPAAVAVMTVGLALVGVLVLG